MRMKKLKWLEMMVLLWGLTSTVFAANFRFQKASEGLKHLNTALSEAESKIRFPDTLSTEKRASSSFIAFPQWIPSIQGEAYVHFIVLQKGERYTFEVARELACDLRKTCLLGSLTLQWGGNPTIYYDRENREKTKRLLLHRGQPGYYTPGFARADFWPARLEWRYHEVLYTLIWQNRDDSAALVRMANSILDQLAQKT